MNFIKKILPLFICFSIAYKSNCQLFTKNKQIQNSEIREIRKKNRSNETYHFKRLQQLSIFSTIWKESKEEKKMFIKNVFPKLYHFINDNSLFEATLLLDSYKKNNQSKETLINSSSNGLRRPKFLSLALQSEYSDFRSRIMKIMGSRYYNPLFYPKKYIITVDGKNTEITTYHFTPTKDSKFLLEGHFKTDSKTGNITYFAANPVKKNKKIESQVIFKNDILNNKAIPIYAKTETHIKTKKQQNTTLKIVSETHHIDTEISQKKLITSNLTLDLDKQEKKDPLFDSIYINKKNDSTHIPLDINKTLDYFESLRYGRLGINKVDILLKHFLSYNSVEGIRFGFGIATNNKWSERYDIGGYVATGTQNSKLKFGSFSNINIHRPTNSKFSINYINDLLEPGQTYFPFSKRIFLNEGFRKYALTKLDRVSRLETKIKTTISKNIFVEAGFTNRNHQPLYDYYYLDQFRKFNTNEVNIGIRYNPNEKFFKLNNRLYSLGSRYPSLFIHYSRSIDLNNYTYYDYRRIDVKIEKNINLMEYGIIDFKLVTGHINTKQLPYPLTYNMQGSFRPGTPIVYNTFQTMRFNEFLATQYAALFYIHNVGKISERDHFKPELLLMHNMGIGNKINIDDHQPIEIKSMEKGFLETGFYLKNLISLQNVVGQTGFGAGFIYRYGPYDHDRNIDNLVFKFSLDFDI